MPQHPSQNRDCQDQKMVSLKGIRLVGVPSITEHFFVPESLVRVRGFCRFASPEVLHAVEGN